MKRILIEEYQNVLLLNVDQESFYDRLLPQIMTIYTCLHNKNDQDLEKLFQYTKSIHRRSTTFSN